MVLTDFLKLFVRASALGLALYSCGGEEKGCQTDYDCREPRVCVRGYCENPYGYDNGGDDEVRANNNGGSFCDRLCEKVWQECDLTGANYHFGDSYSDCLDRCPDFLENLQDCPRRDGGQKKANECILKADCRSLENGDPCKSGEGDLFENYSTCKEY